MWEIYAYGNAESLGAVFNGIAALMGSGDYLGLLRTIGLFALLVAVVSGLGTGRFIGFQWFMGLVLFYSVLFVPKTTVAVVDRLNIAPPATIQNVPIGIAFFGHLSSKIGDYFTTAFETVFSLPNDIRYQGNGVLFGHTMIASSRSFVIRDAQLRKDMNNFIRNCTIYDVLDGSINLTALKNSGDLWAAMATTNEARFTTVGANQVVTTCRLAYNDYLTPWLTAEVAAAQEYYGRVMNPHQTNSALAAAALNTQLMSAYQYYMSIAQSAEAIIRQNMVANITGDSGAVLAQELNDPAAAQLALAHAQATAVTRSSYLTMAKVAQDSLPKIRNVIEVVVLAVFPFVFLMTLMPARTAVMALKSYAITLLWIQLWPPLYAVLNMVVSIYSQKEGIALTLSGAGNALTLGNAIQVLDNSVSTTAIAGYMVLSIPVIAYALVKGGEMVMSSLAGSVMQPTSAAAQQAGTAVATGNLSYGNVGIRTTSADTTTAFKHNVGFEATASGMSTFHSAAGTRVGDGSYESWNGRLSSFGITPQVSMEQVAQIGSQGMRKIGAGLTNVVAHGSQTARNEESSNDWKVQTRYGEKNGLAIAQEISEKLNTTTGVDHSYDSRTTGGFQGNVGLSGNLGTTSGVPQGGGKTVGGGVHAGGGVVASHTKTDSNRYQEATQAVQDILSKHGYNSLREFVGDLARTRGYQDSVARSDSFKNDVNANLTKGVSHTELAGEMEASRGVIGMDLRQHVYDRIRRDGMDTHETMADMQANPQRYRGYVEEVTQQVWADARGVTLAKANAPTTQRDVVGEYNGYKGEVPKQNYVPDRGPKGEVDRKLDSEEKRIAKAGKVFATTVEKADENSKELRDEVRQKLGKKK